MSCRNLDWKTLWAFAAAALSLLSWHRFRGKRGWGKQGGDPPEASFFFLLAETADMQVSDSVTCPPPHERQRETTSTPWKEGAHTLLTIQTTQIWHRDCNEWIQSKHHFYFFSKGDKNLNVYLNLIPCKDRCPAVFWHLKLQICINHLIDIDL